MSEAPHAPTDKAREMRLAFDRSFAEDQSRDVALTDDLLAFRAAAEPYAFRLADIGGLFADRKITPLPTTTAGLLGLANVRGELVSVYDLSVLLGRPSTEAPRWLALALGAPLALAFETFDGHLRVQRDAIRPREGDDPSHRLIREFASTAGLVRPVVHMASVLEAVFARQPRTSSTRER
jgi:chemotaxis signal transduction protein